MFEAQLLMYIKGPGMMSEERLPVKASGTGGASTHSLVLRKGKLRPT